MAGGAHSHEPDDVDATLLAAARALQPRGSGTSAPSLVAALGEVLSPAFVLLCVVEPDGERLRTLVAWSRAPGAVPNGFNYPIAGGPCEESFGRGLVLIREGLAERYPTSEFIRAHALVSFASAPVNDEQGAPLGVLSLFDTAPLQKPGATEAALRVFALVSGAELQRERLRAAQREHERRLRSFLERAPFGVYFYELRGERLEITSISPAGQDIAWVDTSQQLGLTVEEAYPALADSGLPEALLAVAHGGSAYYDPEFHVFEAGRAGILDLHAFQIAPGQIAVVFSDVTQARQTETALRESERRLQAFLDNSPVGVYFYELRGDDLVLVGGNAAADRITGIPGSELYGKTLDEAFPPLLGTDLPDRYRAVARGELERYENFRVGYEGGAQRGVFDVHVFPLGGARIAALFREVSEQVRVEEAERQAARLEATATLAGGVAHDFNNLLGGILTSVTVLQRSQPGWDEVEPVLRDVASAASRATDLAQQLLAYARGGRYEARSLDLRALVRDVVAHYRRRLPAGIELVVAPGEATEPVSGDAAQLRLLVRSLLVNAIEALEAQGRISVRVGQRRVGEQEAKQRRMEAGDVATLEVEDDGPGIPDHVRARVFEPYFSTKAPGRGMGLAAAYGVARNHGGAIEVESRAGGGTIVTVLLPLEESRGAFSLAQLRDAEHADPYGEWLATQGSLEGLGSLALGVAHDLNNLLTLALDALGAPDRLSVARDTLRRCGELTGRLLALGRAVGDERPVSLNDAVRAVAALLRSAVDERFDVVLDLAPDLPPVDGLGHRLESALLNLCLNSRDAMPQGGRLTISTGRIGESDTRPYERLPPGDYVFIAVQDTGLGMTRDVLARAREPLYSTKAGARGTGLGLAMVDRVVRDHGGVLELRSWPGQGTTATVFLPEARPEPAAAPPVAPPPAPPTARGLRILLVDDSEHVARSTSQLLRLDDHEVDIARTGEEALAAFERADPPFDVVLLDLVLPGMGGAATFQRLRALRPGQPIVVCSGYGRQEAVRELVRQGALFLGKPFDYEVLLERIREASGR